MLTWGGKLPETRLDGHPSVCHRARSIFIYNSFFLFFLFPGPAGNSPTTRFGFKSRIRFLSSGVNGLRTAAAADLHMYRTRRSATIRPILYMFIYFYIFFLFHPRRICFAVYYVYGRVFFFSGENQFWIWYVCEKWWCAENRLDGIPVTSSRAPLMDEHFYTPASI